jgi:hypothetical protein
MLALSHRKFYVSIGVFLTEIYIFAIFCQANIYVKYTQ